MKIHNPLGYTFSKIFHRWCMDFKWSTVTHFVTKPSVITINTYSMILCLFCSFTDSKNTCINSILVIIWTTIWILELMNMYLVMDDTDDRYVNTGHRSKKNYDIGITLPKSYDIWKEFCMYSFNPKSVTLILTLIQRGGVHMEVLQNTFFRILHTGSSHTRN